MDGDWRSDLDIWLAPFLAALRHKTRIRMCPAYIAGLIGPGDRKSIQPMAARAGFSCNRRTTDGGRLIQGRTLINVGGKSGGHVSTAAMMLRAAVAITDDVRICQLMWSALRISCCES